MMPCSEDGSPGAMVGDGVRVPKMTVDQARRALIAAFDQASTSDRSYIVNVALTLAGVSAVGVVGQGSVSEEPRPRRRARQGFPYLRLIQG